MASLRNRLSLRQWLLIGIMVPVALLFLRKRVLAFVPDFPTRAVLAEEAGLLDKRAEQLRKLEERLAAQDAEVEALRGRAAPLWRIDDRSLARQRGLIQNEVNRLLAKANVRGADYQVMNPRRLDLPGKSLVYEVEVTVNITATMREIGRVLLEVDRSPIRLTWNQCTIAPHNLREPNKVRLTGTLRAFALAPEAVEFLARRTEEPG